MTYDQYEYYFWRASLMKPLGEKLKMYEFYHMTPEKRTVMLENIIRISTKIILETDTFELSEDQSRPTFDKYDSDDDNDSDERMT